VSGAKGRGFRRAEGVRGFRSRRGFLLQASAAMGLGFPLPRWLEEWRSLGLNPEPARVTPFLTPGGDFYLVAVDPSFRPGFGPREVESRWSLALTGLQGQSRAFGYGELLARATRRIFYTYECIGNPVGGQLIGNAEWHVIPLAELLSEAPGGTGAARSVMFTGLDDFYSSVSAQRAFDGESFLALRMNGAPLPAAHGFPARVILPDLYGMKQPRWLKQIALQPEGETTSFWEKRGWAGEVPVKTTSRLDPRGEPPAGKPLALTGIAFAGRRGVRKVEVSLDDGRTWADCELLTPLRAGVWSLWRYEWRDPTAGSVTLQVRATDGTGQTQTAQRSDAYPDGATGYDRESTSIA